VIIGSKTENYRLYETGAFGNKLRTWASFEEIEPSGYSGKVVMRYKGSAGGSQYPRIGQQITIPEARHALDLWVRLGAKLSAVAYNEAAPDHVLLIQGEVMLSTDHFSIFYSQQKTSMRTALRNGKQVDGIRALCMLRHYLFPSSFEDIQELFERFPDSVIEFSAYEHAIGSLRARNAVIWEVRNY
jgi:hypothetical protein